MCVIIMPNFSFMLPYVEKESRSWKYGKYNFPEQVWVYVFCHNGICPTYIWLFKYGPFISFVLAMIFSGWKLGCVRVSLGWRIIFLKQSQYHGCQSVKSWFDILESDFVHMFLLRLTLVAWRAFLVFTKFHLFLVLLFLSFNVWVSLSQLEDWKTTRGIECDVICMGLWCHSCEVEHGDQNGLVSFSLPLNLLIKGKIC